MWNSLKRSAKRFRSRSRDKLTKKNLDDSRLAQSQPDISNHSEDGHSPGPASTDRDFDVLFAHSSRRQEQLTARLENGERLASDPSGEGADGRSRSEEKDSEIDSGIAVVEHSVSSCGFYLLL